MSTAGGLSSKAPATGKDADAIDLIIASKDEITAYIKNKTTIYNSYGFTDSTLLEYFKEDFEGWEEKHWLLADKYSRGQLKCTLLKHGVYIPPHKGIHTISITLAETLADTEEHVWTGADIHYALEKGGTPMITAALYNRMNSDLTGLAAQTVPVSPSLQRSNVPANPGSQSNQQAQASQTIGNPTTLGNINAG